MATKGPGNENNARRMSIITDPDLLARLKSLLNENKKEEPKQEGSKENKKEKKPAASIPQPPPPDSPSAPAPAPSPGNSEPPSPVLPVSPKLGEGVLIVQQQQQQQQSKIKPGKR